MIDEELKIGTRLVGENEAFLAFCPFASQFPYEVWILPFNHHCSFDLAKDREVRGLARIMRNVVRGVESALDNPGLQFSDPHFSVSPRSPKLLSLAS